MAGVNNRPDQTRLKPAFVLRAIFVISEERVSSLGSKTKRNKKQESGTCLLLASLCFHGVLLHNFSTLKMQEIYSSEKSG
jgi:hypothetical protein